MRLTIRALGLELLDIHLTDSPEYETDEQAADEYDPASVLSGGNLASYPIDAGHTDRYMGFTSGLEE